MKHSTSLITLVSIVLVLACSCPASQVIVSTPTNSPFGTSIAQPPESLGTSRDNPAPFGSSITVHSITIKVDQTTRPANEFLTSSNVFYLTPEPGNEYLLVELSITCNLPSNEKCSLIPPVEFQAVTSAGNVINVTPLIELSGQFEFGVELFGEASTTGKLLYEVPQDDENIILLYEPMLDISGTKVFMALK